MRKSRAFLPGSFLKVPPLYCDDLRVIASVVQIAFLFGKKPPIPQHLTSECARPYHKLGNLERMRVARAVDVLYPKEVLTFPDASLFRDIRVKKSVFD